MENRTLAPLPSIPNNPGQFAKWPGEFSAYFEDRFGLRSEMIHAAYFLRDTLPDYSGWSGTVLRGEDGWMYLASGGRDDTIDQWRGVLNMSDAEQDLAIAKLKAWNAWLAERDIFFLIVTPPNKVSLYPEYLPAHIKPVIKTPHLDPIRNRLSAAPELNFVDLEPILREGKKQHEQTLYYRTDTHWNKLGASIGAQTLTQELHQLAPEIPLFNDDDYEFGIASRKGGDLASFLLLDEQIDDIRVTAKPTNPAREVKLPQKVHRTNNVLFEFENSNASTDLSILIFHDSFLLAMEPFLQPAFRHYTAKWNYDLDVSLIEETKPDIVVLEILERYWFNVSQIPWPPDMKPNQ